MEEPHGVDEPQVPLRRQTTLQALYGVSRVGQYRPDWYWRASTRNPPIGSPIVRNLCGIQNTKFSVHSSRYDCCGVKQSSHRLAIRCGNKQELQEAQMGIVMIRCPRTGRDIRTGMTADRNT